MIRKQSNRNEAVESQVRLFTDDFTLTDLPLDVINVPASLHAQNRYASKLDQDHALRMAQSADLGVALPPIVVNQVSATDYRIIDGNHRREVHDLLDRDTIAAYVVKVSPDTFELMCLAANAYNGKALTPAEREGHALKQAGLGLPLTTVAKIWGIPEHRLGELRRAEQGRMKAVAAGLSVTKLTNAAAVHLNRLEPSQIGRLGAEVLRATAANVNESVKAILAAPAADRDNEALRQQGVLAQKRQSAAAPKARVKGTMTARTARQKVREVLVAVRANQALGGDRELRQLLAQLDDLCAQSAKRAA